jgi:bacterioferritin-associated ferredoxin
MSQAEDNVEDEILCTCSGTTRGEIINLFFDGFSLDAISRKTGALSGCAGCEWDIGQLIKQLEDHQKL